MAGRFKQAFGSPACWLSPVLRTLAASGVAVRGILRMAAAAQCEPRTTLLRRGRRAARAPIGWVEFCVEYESRMRDQAVDAARRRAHAQGVDRSLRVNAWVNDKSSR